jgi:hypothetical protein
MKTLIEVKNHYLDVLEEAKEVDVTAPGGKILLSRHKKQLQFLNKVVLYLENTPDSEFLKGQLQLLKKKYNATLATQPTPPPGFQGEKTVAYVAQLKRWKKEHEIDKMKTQLKFMNYIIK